MAISKSTPVRFTPRGLVDTFDATDRFPGACRLLTNLVFDPANPELVISRPGVTTLVDFQAHGFKIAKGFGFISVQAAVGSRIYGLIATTLHTGHDEPFCFDTATQAFVPITGTTLANTPVSPATTGDWTPPTMASVGTMIIFTHPGFDGTTHFFGIIDITNPNAPTWTSTNTVTNALPSLPIAVANFNNRAWFATSGTEQNQVWLTDVLTNPLTITNADQFLVIGDSAPINALSGLPIQTTSSGVLGSLTIFKETQIWQITGDYPVTTGGLAENFVSLTVGTNSPRSIAQAPFGIYFSSTGGPYFLDLLGTLRQVTHQMSELLPDLSVPFRNAVTPTRWAAAYNSAVYRVCGATTIQGVQQTNDYWFDETRRRWNGPHSFQYDCASVQSGYFVLSSYLFPGQLIQSNPVQTLDFVDTDLGTAYFIKLLSSTFPKEGWMAMKQVAESQIELASSEGLIDYLIQAQDDQGNVLDSVDIPIASNGGIWNFFDWDDGTAWTVSNTWGGGAVWGAPPIGTGSIWGVGLARRIPHTYPVPWHFPLVFEKMAIQITTAIAGNVSIGTFYARYQKTGYMTIRSGVGIGVAATGTGGGGGGGGGLTPPGAPIVSIIISP